MWACIMKTVYVAEYRSCGERCIEKADTLDALKLKVFSKPYAPQWDGVIYYTIEEKES